MTEKLRAAAQQALAYILATGEHDQLCDVLDLDDEGRHKPCSCLLQDVLDALRAALAEQQEPEHISSPDCWCGPELDYKDPDTGAEVWVHRRMQ